MQNQRRVAFVSKLSVSIVIASFFVNILLVPSGFAGDRLSEKKAGLISRYYSVDQVLANSILDTK